MGVYSELAAQKIEEQNALENFQFSDLLEFAINIEKSDQAMFDAMLEMDFHEAYVEKGLISLNEGEKIDAAKAAVGKVWEKIKELIHKFLSMVGTFIAKLKNIYADLTNRNERLIKRFGDLNKDNILKTVGDKKIEVKIVKDKEKVKSIIMGQIPKFRTNLNNCLNGGVEIDAAKKFVEDELAVSAYSDIEGDFDTVSVVDFVNTPAFDKLKDSVKSPKKDIDQVIKVIEGFKDEIEKAEDKVLKDTDTDSDEDRLKCNKIIGCLNEYMKGASKLLSFTVSFYARVAATERSLYAKLGSLDKKKEAPKEDKAAAEAPTEEAKAEEVKKESAEIDFTFMAIDVMNESYIEQLFA